MPPPTTTPASAAMSAAAAQRCPGCFAAGAVAVPCARCGFDPAAPRPEQALPLGALLAGRFIIGTVSGAPDGFGIDYLAWDQVAATTVVLQAYVPTGLATRAADGETLVAQADAPAGLFQAGLEQFLAEGRRLARLTHPNVCAVREVFTANGSAWRVLDHLPGETLAAHLARQPLGRLPEAAALALLDALLAGLAAVHASGLLHRDLCPESVWLATDGQGRRVPILCGFAAAREALAARGLPTARQLRPGYAAPERYDGDGQGTWTDVYAAAALGYRLLTGRVPPPASVRAVRDDLAPAKAFGVSRPVSATLARALALRPALRTPTAVALRAALAPGHGARFAPLLDWLHRRPRPRRWVLAVPLLIATAAGGAWLLAVQAQRAGDAAAWAVAVVRDSEDGYLDYLGACEADGCGQRAAAEQRLAGLRASAGRAFAAAVAAERAQASRRARAERAAAAAQRAELQAVAEAALAGAPASHPAALAPPTAAARAPVMVRIPAGSFLMGSPEREPGRAGHEGPQHRVRVAAFELAATEVTFAQWDACVAARACRAQPDDQGFGRGERPAINLSWEDTQAYLTWLNRGTGQRFRLPSEAEWEYAARAGSTTGFSTGRCISSAEANFNAREGVAGCPAGAAALQQTRPVGGFPPNAWGLHDMHGNAQEWVADCWNSDYFGAPGDGSAWQAGNCGLRVLRGGGWPFGAAGVRSAARDRYSASARYLGLGFRIARSLAP